MNKEAVHDKERLAYSRSLLITNSLFTRMRSRRQTFPPLPKFCILCPSNLCAVLITLIGSGIKEGDEDRPNSISNDVLREEV